MDLSSTSHATPSEPELISQEAVTCMRSYCKAPRVPSHARCAYHQAELKKTTKERKRKEELGLCSKVGCLAPRSENKRKCVAHSQDFQDECCVKGCHNQNLENRKRCLYHNKCMNERNALRAKRSRETGMCYISSCKEPTAPGRISCSKHSKRNNEYRKKCRLESAAIGVCSYHACTEPRFANKGMCERHQKERTLSRKKREESQRAKGLCTQCNQPRAPKSTALCLEHLEKRRERYRSSKRIGRLQQELKNDQRSEDSQGNDQDTIATTPRDSNDLGVAYYQASLKYTSTDIDNEIGANMTMGIGNDANIDTIMDIDKDADTDMAMDICSDADADLEYEDDVIFFSECSLAPNPSPIKAVERPAQMDISFLCD